MRKWAMAESSPPDASAPQLPAEPTEPAVPAALAAPETPIEELVALYEKHRGDYHVWLEHIKQIFEGAPTLTRNKIYSVRSRLKDSAHLREKIERKRREEKVINLENLFEVIQDLAGARIITLYRWDFEAVHLFIMDQCATWWKIHGDPEAYCAYEHDEARFERIGLKAKRRAEKPYTSVHYTVSPPERSFPRCEIQVRGLHLEGWGEVDHELRYPSRKPGPLAEDVLVALHQAAAVTDWLAHLARSADDLQQTLDAERKEKQATLAKLQTLSAELLEAGSAKQKADEIIADLRRQLASATPYRGVTGSLAATLDGVTASALALRCDICRGSTYPKTPSAKLRVCVRCGKTYCANCAGVDGLLAQFGSAGSKLFDVTAGIAGGFGIAKKYSKYSVCKDCGPYAE
jgi:putative GTP pyrophosphokinase